MKRQTLMPGIIFAIGCLPFLLFGLRADANELEGVSDSASSTKRPPNVMIILVDDLGFSDVGCYGGEIETPNLDQLASNGLRFSQFYNTGRCWPTRSSIMTGYYAQQVRRDKLPNIKSGGGGVRPDWAQLLPRMLKPLGYRSYHSGKWHIDGKPVENGFDRSYWLNDHGRFFSPQRTWLNDEKLAPVARDSGYYATTAVADHAIAQLQEHVSKSAEAPFFQFVTFTAPHFPLHALPEDIEKYKRKYDDGWEASRARRWERIKKLEIVSGELSAVEREQGPPYPLQKSFPLFGPGEVAFPLEWGTLTEEQKEFQAAKMAIHAAMVDRVDQEIGRLLDQLRSMAALENTLILFLSDNGASAEIMIRDDGHDSQASPGSAATHLCLGPGWSTHCNTPFRKHKTWVHEGGISTPLIVHWPAGVDSPGGWRRSPAHVIDIVPTILEVAGGDFRKLDERQPDLPGRSLVNVFEKDVRLVRDCLWWSHENHRAIRMGDWKLVKTNKTDWELFNLENDRMENNDLADRFPEKVKQLEKTWQDNENRFIDDLRATADLK